MFVHEGIYALTGLQEQAIDTAAWKGARSPPRGMILITVLYILFTASRQIRLRMNRSF